MRVLHVITSLEIGGAQRLISDLLPIQKEQGLDVDLLVNFKLNNDFSKKIERAGINIVSLDNPNILSLKNLFEIRKIIKNYDIIHAHLFPTLYWVALASIGLHLKLIYTEHSTTNRRRNRLIFKPIEKFIYKQYNKIISISNQAQTALQNWLNCNNSKIITIENGVDLNKFQSKKPLQINPRILIMVSRFVESKDQETVIRSIKYLNQDIILRLVGDGKNLEYCKKIAIDEGVADKVHFLGSRSDIAELIAESYIGIQSSNWEGFGLTAVELMAAGKPVIASNVDGLKQVVEGAGLIFKRGDIKGLATSINHLLNNPDIYKIIAKQCEDRASQYDINIMAEKYKLIYEER